MPGGKWPALPTGDGLRPATRVPKGRQSPLLIEFSGKQGEQPDQAGSSRSPLVDLIATRALGRMPVSGRSPGLAIDPERNQEDAIWMPETCRSIVRAKHAVAGQLERGGRRSNQPLCAANRSEETLGVHWSHDHPEAVAMPKRRHNRRGLLHVIQTKSSTYECVS
jgi:hypothetical protein